MKSFLIVTTTGVAAYGLISLYKNEEKFYRNFVMPIVHLLDAEKAHNLALAAIKYRLFPRSRFEDPEILKTSLFGKEFLNPVGIAAGFDKNAEAVLGLFDTGFGFVEVGSVTPKPQPGNPKPRVFRLKADLAVINRYGFNNDGHAKIVERLNEVKQSNIPRGPIGVNLGKNKTSESPVGDYVDGVRNFGCIADYLVINISSPNTPGLRTMQNKEILSDLLEAVISARDALPNKIPILLKLAPDLNLQEKKDIANVIARKKCKIDGLIVSNTTVTRPDHLSVQESGGLSGKPLKDASTKMIEEMYRLTHGSVPIIGVGGVSSGQDAFDKIRAGASLVQIYTGIVYEGPPIVAKIKRELVDILRQNNFSRMSDAVGSGVKDK